MTKRTGSNSVRNLLNAEGSKVSRVVLIERHKRIEPDIEKSELTGLNCELITIAVNNEDDVIRAVAGADVVVDSSLPMPASVIKTLNQCRLIVRLGHGYESVDIQAATAAGIMVANTAGATSEEVSSHAMALMLSFARRLYHLNKGIREGHWDELWSRDTCSQIWGETLGIMGFGHIGRAMARKANIFRMNVITHDPFIGPWIDLEENVSQVSFNELLARSDFISIHAAYTPQSHHVFSDTTFRKMKSHAFLINTARGPFIDEQALIRALRSNHIAGAGLDVFETEPIEQNNPLLEFDNVILTPHIAGSSPGGWERIRRSAARDVARFLRGETPHSLVNPEVLTFNQP